MKLVNLTPHIINLSINGVVVAIEPAVSKENAARVSAEPGQLASVDVEIEEGIISIPVAMPSRYGEIVNLPAPQEGILYIVSGMVAQAAKRGDVLFPGTGPADQAVRNEAGQIIAVTRLIASA